MLLKVQMYLLVFLLQVHLQKKWLHTMNHDSIIFAMANPDPEIMPDVAKEAGAKVVGTGRSDFPNQVNNVLAFPGIFRGALMFVLHILMKK